MGKVGFHGHFSSWQIQLRFARLIKGCFELLRLYQKGKNDSFDLTKIIAGIRLLSVLFQNNVKSMTNIRQRRISCDKITHDLFFILDWLYFAQDFDSNSLHTHMSSPLFSMCGKCVAYQEKTLKILVLDLLFNPFFRRFSHSVDSFIMAMVNRRY